MQRFMGDFTTRHFLLDMYYVKHVKRAVCHLAWLGESRDISEPEAYALVAALSVGGDTPYWEKHTVEWNFLNRACCGCGVSCRR